MTIETFMFVLSGGVVLGALYALMASGLAVVWTTLGIFNFAHGAFIAFGAYIGWQFANIDGFGLGHFAGVPAALFLMFLFGVLFHLVLVKPFERKANIVTASVITTLAGAAILENGIQLLWGPRSKRIDPVFDGTMEIGGVILSYNDLVLVLLVGICLTAVGLFLHKSRYGRSMRAVAQNREAAELMGLNVPLLYAVAFGLSARRIKDTDRAICLSRSRAGGKHDSHFFAVRRAVDRSQQTVL